MMRERLFGDQDFFELRVRRHRLLNDTSTFLQGSEEKEFKKPLKVIMEARNTSINFF